MNFNMRCPFHTFALGVVTTGSIVLAHKAWSTIDEQQLKREKTLPRELDASILYSEELEVAVELALACGEKMNAVLGDLNKSKVDKASGNDAKSADYVTATDQENELYIFEVLRRRFPKHKFIGEEESSENGRIPPLTDDPTWIIDPVDGTTNFVHSNPATCISIGLCVSKRPVVGVVYCGATNELFTRYGHSCAAFP
jgi:fructose-1,6-bisphosphatase/inositol monophosphatase family enzyme